MQKILQAPSVQHCMFVTTLRKSVFTSDYISFSTHVLVAQRVRCKGIYTDKMQQKIHVFNE